MAVLITEYSRYDPEAIELYKSFGPVYLGESKKITESITHLVVRLGVMLDSNYLSNYPKLTTIVTTTTGTTHIDQEYCAAKNIRVISLNCIKDKLSEITSTAELTIGLMISLLRNIHIAHKDVVECSNWNREIYESSQLQSLSLGLVGFGRVAKHVASFAHLFGMRVSTYDPCVKDLSVFPWVTKTNLLSLMGESDIISIHAAYDGNENLIGKNEISNAKRGSIIVNTARGQLLDEAAVVAALEQGKLRGVAVDVLSIENTGCPVTDSPLVLAARKGLNVLITPHLGGCTFDAMRKTERLLARYVVQN